MMHEWACCLDEAANHLPVVHSCSHLNHPNTFCRGMFRLNATLDAAPLLFSVILNVKTTRYTCSLNSIYWPHWLVQWSSHWSCMCIPVHSSWLPGYMDVTKTILIILTIVGVFLERPHIYSLYYYINYNIVQMKIYHFIIPSTCAMSFYHHSHPIRKVEQAGISLLVYRWENLYSQKGDLSKVT